MSVNTKINKLQKPTKPPIDVDCGVANAEVYSDAKYDYLCSLTFTNIGMNSNKFYIMQIIHVSVPINSCNYALYTKYGRTGERGIVGIKWIANAQVAIKAFATQYKSKTGNVWGSNSEPKSGKYYDLKVDNNFEVEVEEDTTISSSTINVDERIGDEVTDLIKLISDTNVHLQAIRSFGVDTKKMPLGKISKVVIEEANGVLYALSEIVKAIDDGTWKKSKEVLGVEDDFVNKCIYNLSNTFWTRIPYACGRVKPPIIDSMHQVDRCAELLDIIKNSKIVGHLVKKNKGIFDIYKSLNTDIKMCTNAKEVKFVTNFVMGTKAPTHNYKLEMLEIYSIVKDVEDVGNMFGRTSNHMLLAHGSRMSNLVGIFSTGLRIPGSTQVSNGSILGRGIYFADVISKSFNYCNARDTNDIGFVLLCEVALGNKCDKHETVVPYNKVELPKGYTYRMGMGQTDVTNMIEYEYKSDVVDKYLDNLLGSSTPTTCVKQKVNIPQGGLKDRKGLSSSASFLYNEYVIFNERQYRFRYLVKIKSS
jgi:poly [ADP-ribose] polymerase